MNAQEILRKAAGHMTDRASTYDKPEGERSMAQTVAIFNLYHGTSLTEAQGWHLLQILKDVRLFSRDGYHADSAEDCVAYAALKAEAMSAGIPADPGYSEMIAEGIADADAGRVTPLEEVKARRKELWSEADERRMDVVAQNGNDGAVYRDHQKPVCLACGGSHPLARCGRDRATAEDESQ